MWLNTTPRTGTLGRLDAEMGTEKLKRTLAGKKKKEPAQKIKSTLRQRAIGQKLFTYSNWACELFSDPTRHLDHS